MRRGRPGGAGWRPSSSERRAGPLAAARPGCGRRGCSPENDAARAAGARPRRDPVQLLLVDEVPATRPPSSTPGRRRAAREPLQHLTGVAYFRHVELGRPGVFVPRPETELLAGWAIEQLGTPRGLARPSRRVVDLGTGSGAIAKAIADEVPTAGPRRRARRARTPGRAQPGRHRGRAAAGRPADAFDDLAGAVDVVVSNPPYIPLEAWESVAAEARDHDPHLALFSGADGLDAIRPSSARRRAAAPGGVVGVEHADVQGESAPAVFAARAAGTRSATTVTSPTVRAT